MRFKIDVDVFKSQDRCYDQVSGILFSYFGSSQPNAGD